MAYTNELLESDADNIKKEMLIILIFCQLILTPNEDTIVAPARRPKEFLVERPNAI